MAAAYTKWVEKEKGKLIRGRGTIARIWNE